MSAPVLIRPDWEAPPSIGAVATTRRGGCSREIYASLNLGSHVGDEEAAVAVNRVLLREAAALPAEPLWMRQVHGATVVAAEAGGGEPAADAAVACSPGRVLAVLTADCLAVLLAAADGSAVGIAHAGWRGLAAGVVEAALAAMPTPARGVVAWLGPAIELEHYEVGAEVFDAFAGTPGHKRAFERCDNGGWRCNLVALARARLKAAGVSRVGGGTLGTYADHERFYSYRRDGLTGRTASLVWIR